MAERPRRPLPAPLLALGLALCAPLASADSTPSYQGSWRIERGLSAPWQGEEAHADNTLVGRQLRFESSQSRGPGVLECGDAKFEPTQFPAEGLFQGNLPAPAATAAQALGFAVFPVQGFSLNCSSGLFEFHEADGDTLLLALDNVIWTLSRANGALAAPDSPEGVVQALLEAHFGGDMGFDEASVAQKKAWLGAGLQARIATYFARPRPEDEVPPVDGDPFTDSQEYPTRFAVRAGQSEGAARVVPVDFADGFSTRRLDYLLLREADGRWRVDELRSPHGSLGELLAQ